MEGEQCLLVVLNLLINKNMKKLLGSKKKRLNGNMIRMRRKE
jgi:hypothetical protein